LRISTRCCSLPDLGARIDGQACLFGELSDLGLVARHIQPEAGLIESQQDVLGDGEGVNEREVLVDHAQAHRDGIAR